MDITESDPTIADLLHQEKIRQEKVLRLIPSENYVSKAVLEAVGSVVVNKYSEGQVGKRYYQGNENIDEIEKLAKERALKLFDLDPDEWAVNVQATTGSIANLAVYLSLLNIGDPILSMHLYDGGHLSHGWQLPSGKKISMTSKIFDPHYYRTNPDTGLLDYNEVERQTLHIRPKMIVSGGTAYPRNYDYERLGNITQKVEALYLADVAHEAGLIAGNAHPSPFEHADVVTMTTRKTLRGPIGALIFAKKETMTKIDSTVFPGLQGGPLNNNIAGIAVALREAAQPKFKGYSTRILKNATALAEKLQQLGIKLVSGGTDKHLMVLDLTNKKIDGWCTALALEKAGIIVNRNTIPGETRSPFYPSGIRLGTPAVTTRGMKEKEMGQIAGWINEVVTDVQGLVDDNFESEDKEIRASARKEFKGKLGSNSKLQEIKQKVESLCSQFPTP